MQLLGVGEEQRPVDAQQGDAVAGWVGQRSTLRYSVGALDPTELGGVRGGRAVHEHEEAEHEADGEAGLDPDEQGGGEGDGERPKSGRRVRKVSTASATSTSPATATMTTAASTALGRYSSAGVSHSTVTASTPR
jgi:hypothetical protein